MSTSLLSSQNDQSTGEIKVIGGDDLSTLTGKVRNMEGSMIMTKTIFVDTMIYIGNDNVNLKLNELEMRNKLYF